MTEHNFDLMRRAMVTGQLRTNAVNDPRVVAAMASVPREAFLPRDAAPIAYTDRSLPLGGGRFMPSPMITGRLLTEAHIRPEDRCLVVAAATGYSAAVLAALAARVTALDEADAPVPGPAAASLTRVTGPLDQGWASDAPYDVILIDGAVEEVPDALVVQLADGGRLATGLVDAGGVTRLAIGRKAGESFGLTPFADAEVPVLASFTKPKGFRF